MKRLNVVTIAWIALVLAVLILPGCSDENSDLPAYKLHPLAWSAPESWGSSDFHGPGILSEAQAAQECGSCHGLDLLGSGPVPGCTDCHNNLLGGHPNDIDYAAPQFHGLDAIAAFQLCKMCHGADYQGGITGVSCYACHNGPGLNHPSANWLNRASVAFHGADPADCRLCHGADWRGGSTGVGCFTCHFDENGSESPLGVNFTFASNTHNDGNLHQSLSVYQATCNNCHATNRLFGNPPPPGCHDCHGDGD